MMTAFVLVGSGLLIAVPSQFCGHIYLPGLVAGIGLGAAGVGLAALIVSRAKHHALDILERHNFELCMWCNYDLRNLAPSGRCPECGRGYDKDSLPDGWMLWLAELERIDRSD